MSTGIISKRTENYTENVTLSQKSIVYQYFVQFVYPVTLSKIKEVTEWVE